jgi:hypothetical protein
MPVDTPLLAVPQSPGVWQHPRLVWWAVCLREHGYRGRVPTWALRWCWCWYPAPTCRCQMYRVLWTDQEVLDGEGEE